MKRDDLIIKHIPLVKSIVNKLQVKMSSFMEYDDMYSVGLLGLVLAADKFDPSHKVMFKSFAKQRIKGAILDSLRIEDHLSRNMRSKQKKIEATVNLLEHKHHRCISNVEIAEELNIPLQDVDYILTNIQIKTTEEDKEDIYLSIPDSDLFNSENILITNELIKLIINAIDSLTHREQLVFALYYYEAINLKDIGKLLNLTESRIAQILHKSLYQILEVLNGESDE